MAGGLGLATHIGEGPQLERGVLVAALFLDFATPPP